MLALRYLAPRMQSLSIVQLCLHESKFTDVLNSMYA